MGRHHLSVIWPLCNHRDGVFLPARLIFYQMLQNHQEFYKKLLWLFLCMPWLLNDANSFYRPVRFIQYMATVDQQTDKLAAIRELFDNFVDKCKELFIPSPYVCTFLRSLWYKDMVLVRQRNSVCVKLTSLSWQGSRAQADCIQTAWSSGDDSKEISGEAQNWTMFKRIW